MRNWNSRKADLYLEIYTQFKPPFNGLVAKGGGRRERYQDENLIFFLLEAYQEMGGTVVYLAGTVKIQ